MQTCYKRADVTYKVDIKVWLIKLSSTLEVKHARLIANFYFTNGEHIVTCTLVLKLILEMGKYKKSSIWYIGPWNRNKHDKITRLILGKPAGEKFGKSNPGGYISMKKKIWGQQASYRFRLFHHLHSTFT